MPHLKAINFDIGPTHVNPSRKIVLMSATCSRADRPKMFGARVAMSLGRELGWIRELPKLIGHRERVMSAYGYTSVWVTLDITMTRQDGQAGASDRGIDRYQRFTAAAIEAGYTIEWQYHRPGYQTRADFERCLRPANLVGPIRAYAD